MSESVGFQVPLFSLVDGDALLKYFIGNSFILLGEILTTIYYMYWDSEAFNRGSFTINLPKHYLVYCVRATVELGFNKFLQINEVIVPHRSHQ